MVSFGGCLGKVVVGDFGVDSRLGEGREFVCEARDFFLKLGISMKNKLYVIVGLVLYKGLGEV